MVTRLRILDPSMRSALETGGFKTFEDFARTTRGELVSHSTSTITRRITLGGQGAPEAYYLKVYNYADQRRRMRWEREKSEIEVRNYRLLRDDCGIRVPDIVAQGNRRTALHWLDGFIMTRGVPAAIPVEHYVDRLNQPRGRLSAHPAAAHLLAVTAELVSGMHASGFFHIDLQWRNLLVSDDGTDRPDVYLIDSVRGGRRYWPAPRAHGRIRDLSSLHKDARRFLSAREQLRWFKRYLRVPRLNALHRLVIDTILHDRVIKDGASNQ